MDSLSPDSVSTVLAIGGLDFIDPQYLIKTFGLIGLILIVFSESCFAFFLPGDSLLFTAGFLSANDDYGLNIALVCFSVTIAAIAGNQVGYLTGRRLGPAMFSKEKSRLFKKEHLDKTHAYFEHHGPKTIVIARFIPIVRTFACIVAGAARMDYKLFLTYNIVGGVLWGTGLTLVGWIAAKTLGEFIDIDKYLLPIILVILVVSFIPIAREYIKAKRHFDAAPVTPAGEVAETIKEEIHP